MKILVVGSGGREHALAWKLRQSPKVAELLVAPGNAGTANLAENVPILSDDIDGLLRFARSAEIDLTIVGPEGPLAAGIVDGFYEAGLNAFGPTKAAARIESSKSFAKDLMLRHGIPTAAAAVFDSYTDATKHLESCPVPIVVKADGLAAGKGVVVAQTLDEARDALRLQMVDRQLGSAADAVLIEECLQGQEVSVFAFVDGEYVSPLAAACDYKRAGDGDTGPNTGGMGSFSPPLASVWTSDLETRVRGEIMEPVARAMVSEGYPYCGMLYLGIILTASGPKVLEFNCRFGDPEAQVILPRLKADLAEVTMCTALGALDRVAIEWEAMACVGVVVASGGYPGKYRTGYEISGLDDQVGTVVFHAGTKAVSNANGVAGGIVTDGGRVLSVTATGQTLAEARASAYCGVERIRFRDSFSRRDIAAIR